MQTIQNLLVCHPHCDASKLQDGSLNPNLPTASGGATSTITSIPVVAASAAPAALVHVADAATASQARHDIGATGAALSAVDAGEARAALTPVGGAGALLKGQGLEVAAGLDGDIVAGVALRRGGEEGDGEEEDAELHCCFSPWFVWF